MEVRERILQKAAELFMQYGIRSVSMDDIATQLGMSKKTIYQSFADKDALVDAVMQLDIAHREEECIHCNKDAMNAVHEIFLTMENLLEQFRYLNPVVVYDLEKFHYNSFKKFMAFKHDFIFNIVRQNLEWGIREGLYREDIDVDVLVKFRLESMMLAFDISLFPPAKYNLAHVTVEVLKNFVFGITTIKGYKLAQKYTLKLNKEHLKTN